MFGLKPVIFCGPMKSGTTWVHAYFKQRGDVALPVRTKEIFYFDRYFARGIGWYKSQFDPQPAHQVLVDVAPSIMIVPEAPERVAATFDRAQIVILRRDPVARVWSHYLHLKRYGYTAAPLTEAIEAHPAIIEASRVDAWRDRWQSVFGAAAVTILDADLLGTDPQGFARSIDRVLGLPARDGVAEQIGRINPAGSPRHVLVSKVARKISYGLRDMRMDAVVQLARDLGLNRIYSGSGNSRPPPQLDPASREFIERKLRQWEAYA
ncbi:MAG: sulfotransferase domain-containing protein [Silicimonas sp.]|nr:sulfotransferase domain-containing protein [Silicimonas sp.]